LGSKEKFARLHFYVQVPLGGPNATVWEIARATVTDQSKTSFGQLRVIDDLLTVGLDRDSEKLGRVQGTIASTGIDESAFTMNLNIYFTEGPYQGSTLCIVGRNPFDEKDRELAVVGGTGVFKAARGYAVTNTLSFNPVNNYRVLEYTMFVSYF
ncbi:hypothetical protein M569_09464, partial [Genlisea aurea]